MISSSGKRKANWTPNSLGRQSREGSERTGCGEVQVLGSFWPWLRPCSLTLGKSVYQVPVSAVTICKRGGLKRHELTILWFWRSETTSGAHGVKSRRGRAGSFSGHSQKLCLLALPCSRPPSLAHGPFLRLRGQQRLGASSSLPLTLPPAALRPGPARTLEPPG